ncbi:mariner Mos1 transposase [Trichonephila clavipes]|nr:mariner Mos1 transposase [Trichonephila clavipes]
MGIPYHSRIKATVDGMATNILCRQGQRQKMLSKCNIMEIVFWDRRGVLLLDFLPQGATINSGAYCANLRKLRRALQNKQYGTLSKGVLLLHDNARPHTPRTTQELIQSFCWEVLDHAPYNLDLSPSDLHFFRYLKHSLGGKRFSDTEELNAAVNSWLSPTSGRLL